MVRLIGFFAALVLASASGAALDAQSTQDMQPAGAGQDAAADSSLTLKLEVRRVPVDVVVTDKQGNPVRGLKKEDFVVKEDDQAQKISSFDYMDGSVPSFVPPRMPELPANTFVNLPKGAERGPLYVLYYDMVNTDPEDQITFRRELLKFVDHARPGTRIAIFVNAAGLHLVQGFTSDRDLLRSAVTSKGPGPHIPEIFLDGENFGRQDMGAATSNLQFISDYLSGISGRKNLIWLAGKFPVSYGPVFQSIAGGGSMSGVAESIKTVFASMMRSQVAIYPVDVKGAVVNEERSPSPAGDAAPDVSSIGNPGAGRKGAVGGGGAGGIGGSGAASAGNGTENGNSTLMEGQSMGLSGYTVTSIDQFQEDYIASSTGGHAYYGNNHLSQSVEKAMELGESYYTLSYSPANPVYDGSDRHIQVSLKGKSGYRLSYRNLYYAVSDDARPVETKEDSLQARFLAAKAQDPLYANIEHGAPMLHDLLFSAHVVAAGEPVMATPDQMMELVDSPVYFKMHKKGHTAKAHKPVKLQKYVIEYGVFDPRLKALAANGGEPGTLEFAVAAYDADGRMLNSLLNDGRPEDGDEPDGKTLFHAEQEIDVPPGAAWIRLAVRDKLDSRTGTLEVRLPLKAETETASAEKVQ